MSRAPLTPSRILVVRLDRIGDVVLSTPALTALSTAIPHAFIAVMVRPECRDLVQGHPAVHEVIEYDKDGRHRSAWATVRFARRLRRYGFDAAIVLHPTNRSHWIPWLAGIPARIGFRRKSSWLLTHRLPHRKQEGKRHEADYTLELLRFVGAGAGEARPTIALQPGAVRRVDEVLAGWAQAGRPIVAIHPSASCPSKRWMPDRFARVADRLIAERGAQVCIVAGAADAAWAQAMAQAMRQPVLNLAGRLTLAELAAVLRRAAVLVSNDSGPVHVAAAVGTPVVAIFGRNQAGLSVQRWGPLGEGHVVLQKDVGCVTCLAHACDIGFRCLTSLAADEVYQAAASLLSRV